MDNEREHYIIGRALYEAVLSRLPGDRRPGSDIDDMVELLSSRYADILGMMSEGDALKPPPPPVVKLVPRSKPADDPA